MMYGFDLEKVMALPKDDFQTVWEIFKSHDLEPVPAVTLEDAIAHEKKAVAETWTEALDFGRSVEEFRRQNSVNPGDVEFDEKYTEFVRNKYGVED